MVFMVLYTAYIMYGFPFRSSSQFFNKNNKHETERKVNDQYMCLDWIWIKEIILDSNSYTVSQTVGYTLFQTSWFIVLIKLDGPNTNL